MRRRRARIARGGMRAQSVRTASHRTLPHESRGNRMTRLLFALTLALALCSATGCAMCCRTYDDAYAAYGGCRPRGDMYHGRVGSASYDAGVPVDYVSSDEAAMYPESVSTGAAVVYGEPVIYDEQLPGGTMIYADGGVPEEGIVYRGDPSLRAPTKRDIDRAIIAEGGFQVVDGKVWIDGQPVDGEVWVDGMPVDRSQMPATHGSTPRMRQASPVRGQAPFVVGPAPTESNFAPVVDGSLRTARGVRPLEPTPATRTSGSAENGW